MRKERPGLDGVRRAVVSRKKFREGTKINFCRIQWQQAPTAWWEFLWRTKHHGFSLTQIETVLGQFSSTAPVMFSNFLALSHQKENNRTEKVLTTLFCSSSHFLSPSRSPYLCWHWWLGAQGLPALIHRQKSHLFQHINKPPSTSHSEQKPKILLEVHSPNHSHQNISWKSVKAFLVRRASTRKPSTIMWDLKESEPTVPFRARVAQSSMSILSSGRLFSLEKVISLLLDSVSSITRQQKWRRWSLKTSSSSKILWKSILPQQPRMVISER